MGIDYALRFTLVLVRVGAVFSFLPIVGDRNVPATVKVFIVLALGIALYPVVGVELPAVELATVPLLLMGVAEMLYGALIGLAAAVIFSSIRVSGEFLGRNIGMAMAIGVDPLSGARTTVVGNFCNAIGVLTFFAMNGHHLMIRALRESFDFWPLGQFFDPELGRQVAVAAVGQSFAIALQLAAPLLVMTFVMTLIMALMARLAPAINVMTFGFALRITIGLFGLALFAPVMVQYSAEVVRTMAWFIRGLTTGGG